MKIKLFDIFLLFFKVGYKIFGGGVVIIPLLEAEAVKKKNWITMEELVEYYSISQVIPGINIANVSMFIGHKLRGKAGAIAAGLGVIFVPFILITTIAFALDKISQNIFVKSALWGISIGTVIVILTTVKSIWKHSIVDKFTLFLFILIFAISLGNFSPALIVLFAIILGVTKGFLLKNEEENL